MTPDAADLVARLRHSAAHCGGGPCGDCDLMRDAADALASCAPGAAPSEMDEIEEMPEGRICPQDGGVCWNCDKEGEHFCRITEAEEKIVELSAALDRAQAEAKAMSVKIYKELHATWAEGLAMEYELAKAEADLTALRKRLEAAEANLTGMNGSE